VKATKTRSGVKTLDDVQFFARQLEQLLFGQYSGRIPIKNFTDSKSLLESIGSIHQVEEKLLQNSITNMKDLLYDGIVQCFSWLDGNWDMMADALTKECKNNLDLENLVLKNHFRLAKNQDNVVLCKSGEIKIMNRCNKSVEFE
jgi:hypothetical protein